MFGNMYFKVNGTDVGNVPVQADGSASLSGVVLPPSGPHTAFPNGDAIAAYYFDQVTNSLGGVDFSSSLQSINVLPQVGRLSNFTGTGIDDATGITAGPDGALWFANYGNSSIGRIDTSGNVTNYTGTGIGNPFSITAGPDGALWFTNFGNNSIGRIDTSGNVTNYTGTGIDRPYSITAGPDGALWFANAGNNSIGRIDTSGNVTNYTGTGIDGPNGITAGPDGALWFANAANNSIGRITTSGAVSNYTGTGIDYPYSITAGPDGALWFTNTGNNTIGRITTSGAVTNYTGTGIDDPADITAGPDGALWFTNDYNKSIGRITTSGKVTNRKGGTGVVHPFGIAAGPGDGALWFGNASTIGSITAVGPAVSSVTILGTKVHPKIVITGSGFGAAPPYPSYSAGCGGSGLDYGYYLYLTDTTRAWTGGEETPTNTNCIGLVVSTWSNKRIVFEFGNVYRANSQLTLGPGDSYSLDVFSTIVTGTVGYT